MNIGINLVKLLLSNGADNERYDYYEKPALDYAVQFGNIPIIKEILKYHPDLLIEEPGCDYKSYMLLEIADEFDQKEAKEWILRYISENNLNSKN
tara:strand:- start:206 stop:490 length:285 start_codon:yes stop_codon:yes gene_type:complete